jgi:hypothetical protein
MRFDPLTALCAGCCPAYWLCRAGPTFRTCFRVRNLAARQPAVPRIELILVQTVCVSSPSELLRLPLPLRTYSVQSNAYPEFLPSSRHRRGRPLHARVAKPTLCSALRFSQPLDGLLRPRLHGLVSSRNHVQGSARPGASRLLQPARLIGDPCPPAVGPTTLIIPKDNGRAPCPRLRGFDPQEVAFLGFRPPPGTIAPALSFGYPKLSAHEVTGLVFRLAAPVPLQRLPCGCSERPVSNSFALLEVSSLPNVSSDRHPKGFRTDTSLG